MNSLTCPLSTLSAELQARTLYHHTVFGLARYITSPAELSGSRHPLDFSFLLGLSSKLAWYSAPISGVSDWAGKYALDLVSKFWQRPWHELDTVVLFLRLAQFTPEMQHTVLDAVYYGVILTPPLERIQKMKNSDHNSVPVEVYNRLEASLAALEQSLLDKDPLMPQHLRNSHAVLVSYPETVHLLQDHEIARLIDAAEIHTKT
jgi:hypothetical protein